MDPFGKLDFPPRCPSLHVVQIGYNDAIWIPYIQLLKIFSGGRHSKTVILQCFQDGLTCGQALKIAQARGKKKYMNMGAQS